MRSIIDGKADFVEMLLHGAPTESHIALVGMSDALKQSGRYFIHFRV
ncbi:hypothetical protein [Rhizobium rhododendri]|uniref:Uncharacterized protein n=1 Tax=Rhizobium rhododendri TaxID=2506430 RepID=A0ABY8IQY1_9HYPH|nr:hypothetical protein [Rhizobium rhododendri]WFS26114.1 hypothetical protein PR018_23430 [Rhizobium rhododendri]